MKRGRPPRGVAHVDRVPATQETKTRLKLILQTLLGEKSVDEACRELDVTESHFHRLREEALAGAAAALEPRPAGRPRQEKDESAAQVEALRAEILELKVDLRAAEIREELALIMPHVLLPRSDAVGGKKGRGKEPGR